MRAIVVGCGYWGRNHVRNFRQLGVLAGVCEPTPEGRAVASSLAPGAPLYPRLDDALSSDADALVIATPAETHHAIAKRALLAGKDVLVEKPLSLTYDQGAELVEIATARERIVMVGHLLEYHPAIVRLIEIVSSGELGELYYVYSNRLSLGKVRREENILWSFAPHDIAVILRIAGSLPIQVSASGASYLQRGIADVTVTDLSFANGVRGHIYVSWLHPFKEQRLVVIGSRKMASFDDVAKRLALYDRRVELRAGDPVPVAGLGEAIPFDETEPLALECAAFARSVDERIPPRTDGASGLRVLRVLQAAESSLVQDGRPILLETAVPAAV